MIYLKNYKLFYKKRYIKKNKMVYFIEIIKLTNRLVDAKVTLWR